MARPPRIEFEGAVYHITARGNERREIHRSDDDRRLFLQTLEEMRKRFGVILHCYCLMPNHFHLVLETPLGNLSKAMAWLQTTYTVRFNRKYRRSGHLFQGRYKAHLVQADEYGMTLVRYIHLNPVRPRKKSDPVPIDKKESLEAYEWSSHRDYLGRRQKPLVEVATGWLCFWHRQKGAARAEYRKFIKAAFGHELETPLGNLKGGLVLGSEELWEMAKEILGKSDSKEEAQWVSQAAQQSTRKKLVKLMEGEKDERMKIWIRVQLGGETMTEIAKEYGYSDGSGVHRVVQRLNRRAGEDRKLKARMAALNKALISG